MPTAATPTKRSLRRQQILSVAARLFAERGYTETGMGDIGAGAGITGPAIYRHFPSKSAILVAIFEDAFEAMVARGREIAASDRPPAQVLDELISFHVAFTLDRQGIIPVYKQDRKHLPEDARRKVAALDLAYRDDWLRVLAKVRVGESFEVLRAITIGALATIVQTARHETTLDRETLESLLIEMATAVVHAETTSRLRAVPGVSRAIAGT